MKLITLNRPCFGPITLNYEAIGAFMNHANYPGDPKSSVGTMLWVQGFQVEVIESQEEIHALGNPPVPATPKVDRYYAPAKPKKSK